MYKQRVENNLGCTWSCAVEDAGVGRGARGFSDDDDDDDAVVLNHLEPHDP